MPNMRMKRASLPKEFSINMIKKKSSSQVGLLSDAIKYDITTVHEKLNNITMNYKTTFNMQHKLAKYGYDTLDRPCANPVIKRSAESISVAAKAIGLVAITHGREKSQELLKSTYKIFSNIKPEDMTVKVLEWLAITTLVGAINSAEILTSMETTWDFICSYSEPQLKLQKQMRWASVMAAAISTWTLLLTEIDFKRLNLKFCWNGVMSHLLDMLEEEEIIQDACVKALGIICEKKCFDRFSCEEYHRDWKTVDWKDEILVQVIKACGWRDECSVFQADGMMELSKEIFGCELEIEAWSQLIRIEFIESFLEEEFTVDLMNNRFILQFFNLRRNDYVFGPLLYVPGYEEIVIMSLENRIDKNGNITKRVVNGPTSGVSKARSKLRNENRKAKEALRTELLI